MPQLSLSRQTLWQAGARICSFVLSVAFPVYLARHLTRSELGVYKQIFMVVQSAMTYLPLGFFMSAFHFLTREPEKKNSFVLNILLVQATAGFGGALVLFTFPHRIALFLKDPELERFAARVSVLIFLWTLCAFLDTLAQANQEPRVASFAIVFFQVSRSALMLFAAFWFGTVSAIVNAALVQAVLQTTILAFYLHTRFPGLWRSFDPVALKRQLSYSLPLSASGLLYLGQLDIHNYVVSHEFSPGQFAIYSNGCLDVPLVSIISDSVGYVMIPKISALQKTGDRDEIVRLTCTTIHKLSLMFFPIYIYLLIVGRDLIELLYSKLYRESGPIFLMSLSLLPFLVLMMDPIMRAYAETRSFLLKLNLTITLVQIPMILIFVRKFGLVGAIGAVVLTGIASRIASTWRVVTLLHVRKGELPQLNSLPRVALAAVASGALTLWAKSALGPLAHWQTIIGAGMVFVPCYVSAIFAIGALRGEEKASLRLMFSHWAERFGITG